MASFSVARIEGHGDTVSAPEFADSALEFVAVHGSMNRTNMCERQGMIGLDK